MTEARNRADKKFITAVDQTLKNGAVTSRETVTDRYHSANSLMLSYALDLLVSEGIISADLRDNQMAKLYRQIGAL